MVKLTARTAIAAVGALLLTAGLASCAPGSGAVGGTAATADDILGTWASSTSYDAPEQPFLHFVDDGTWTGSDGCNGVAGTWELADGGRVTATAGPSTLMYCEGAPLPRILESAITLEIHDGALLISGKDGTVELERSKDPLVGPQDPVGTWTADGGVEITLNSDGTLEGNTGCNGLGGMWTDQGSGQISFSNLIQTMMACEGVDEWVGASATGFLQAGTMTLYNADGLQIGQVHRGVH